MIRFAIATVLIFAASSSAGSNEQNKAGGGDVYSATIKEIRATLGIVPEFLARFPKTALPGAWESLKAVQISNQTAIPNKFKELIGVGVASQIPCRYCVYFHSKFAELNGASSSEIAEAAALAGVERSWSSYFHGNDIDLVTFKSEVDLIVANIAERSPTDQQPEWLSPVPDVATAKSDMAKTFGLVPSVLAFLPDAALPGLWREYRDLVMNPYTAIPLKYKSLIGLAIGAQIPSEYSIFSNTEFARMNGATQVEVREVIALAGQIRHWSSFLNGVSVSEKQFNREVDTMVFLAKRRMAENARKIQARVK